MSTTARTIIEKDITNINNFIKQNSSTSFFENIPDLTVNKSGTNIGLIEKCVAKLDNLKITAKSGDYSHNYNYLFALKRDVKSRYANRLTLYKVGYDKKLHSNIVLASTDEYLTKNSTYS